MEETFNPLGTGDLKFYQSKGLSTFWGLFIFWILWVFTWMVSDNPWCSLWVPSSQSWTSKITITFSCLHIHERTSLTKSDFQKSFLKFNKRLKLATTDQLATSLLGLCEHFALFTRFEGEGHKCSKVDAKKHKHLLFTKIVVFLMYREIYVHRFAIIKQPTWHTGFCIV